MSIIAMRVEAGVAIFGYDGAENTPEMRALGMIESGNNDLAIGKLGEVSRYQILPSVWKKSYKKLYSPVFWRDIKVSSVVAYKQWNINIDCYNLSTGDKPNRAQCYAMWNVGYYKFRDKYKFSIDKLPYKIRERCIRYENLVALYQSNN